MNTDVLISCEYDRVRLSKNAFGSLILNSGR
jgi:hypothetical protein